MNKNLEKSSAEMVDAALNDKTRFMLYGEDSIRLILRFNLEKKYPRKTFLIGLQNSKQVLATNADIEDYVMKRRAPGLGINVERSSKRFRVFEAKSLTDLFNCFVLMDNEK